MIPSTAAPTAPFVATNLTVYRDEESMASSQIGTADVTLNGLPYRRLDPGYYAWLRSRMEKAKKAWQSGKLDEPSFAALKDKFNAIHDEAIRLFGEATLLQAVRALDPKTYSAPTRCSEEQPPRIPGNEDVERRGQQEDTTKLEPAASPTQTKKPVPDMDPSFRFPEEDNPALRFHQVVRRSALEKVQAIESQALSAGWTLPELYQNRGRYRFPYGGDYGIACFVEPGQKLGAVTSHSVQLITRNGHSLTFRRRGQEHIVTTQTHTRTMTNEQATEVSP